MKKSVGAIAAASVALASIIAMCGTALAAPKPLVEFLFEGLVDGKLRNTGATGAEYPFATLTQGVPVLSTNAAPTSGKQAVEFGTEDDAFAIDLPGPVMPLTRLKAFTITGWVNSRDNEEGPGGNRIATWINHGGEGVDLVYKGDGSLQLGVNKWPDGSPAVSTPEMVGVDPAAGKGNWVYFAVTYDSALDSGNVRFHFGRPDKPAAFDTACDYAQDAVGTEIGPEFTIGHFNTATRESAPDRMFRGLIDDIRVFGQVLTLDEIKEVQKL